MLAWLVELVCLTYVGYLVLRDVGLGSVLERHLGILADTMGTGRGDATVVAGVSLV